MPRAGVALTNQAAAAKTANLSSPSNIKDQVSFDGTLTGLVDFGTDGPSAAGGFQFVNGAALKSAFNSAMLFVTSNKELIDTVSVTGQTLTASTSGDDGHDVFTLTLRPQSGQFTFTLLNPIDLPTGVFDPSTTLNLSGLMQGVKSTGQTLALPNTVKITVDGNSTSSSGTAIAGSVHQKNLAYTAPNTSAPAAPAPYTPPVNPLTGHGYAATTSSSQAIGVTLSLFI